MQEKILLGKKILVGVTGSIAIYKTLHLIRLLTKAGASVRVILTESAEKFITPLTFETLTQNQVINSKTENWHSDLNHIAIGKWADAFVIAPLTANSLNKIANGIADNLLLQTVLAYNREIILAPSANTNMLHNPITEANLKLLKLSNFKILNTETKELACKTTGDGAMAEPEDIFFAIAQNLLKSDFWVNRRVVVSGGGTIEKIDEVRFISNFSSGKMASALALALYFRGADVCFISSKFPEKLPNETCKIDVESAEEMFNYIQDSLRIAKKGVLLKPKLHENSEMKLVQKQPFLFMASAVADFKPKFSQNGKVKSHLIGSEWNLELVKNIDILKNLSRDGVFTVGFKAEMDKKSGRDFAKKMLETKNLDAVCFNLLKDSSSFGTDENKIELFLKNEKSIDFEKNSKLILSLNILDELENQLKENNVHS
jgi:phosphopantothenoylcysteine decarboxylase/phosphopantothenate--cysteine ligase